MLKRIAFPKDVDHVVAFEIDGRIEAEGFADALAVVEEKLSAHEQLHLYVELTSLGTIEPKALFDDLKSALRHWDRFDKLAIVTQDSVLPRITPFLDRVLPGIDVQTFSTTQREAAHQWIIA